MISTTKTRPTLWVAVCATMGLILSACAGGVGAETGDTAGSGVAYGATIEEFQSAFEEIDPIALTMQSAAAANSVLSDRDREFVESVDEWSGGKITVQLEYVGAIAGVNEVTDALQDGRIDLGQAIPQAQPDTYPAWDAAMQMSFVTQPSLLTNHLHAGAWQTQLMHENADVREEFDRNGLVPLVGVPGTIAIWCSTPITGIDDISGKILAVASSGLVPLVEALDASPTSLPYTDFYEALSRGTIDCAVTGVEAAAVSGIAEVAPFMVEAGPRTVSYGSGPMLFGKDRWDGLPLVAQQLIYDLIGKNYLATSARSVWETAVELPEILEKAGGESTPMPDDIATVMRDVLETTRIASVAANPALSDGEAFVSEIEDAAAMWGGVITDAGFENSVRLDELAQWLDKNDIDPHDVTDVVFEQVLLPDRPK